LSVDLFLGSSLTKSWVVFWNHSSASGECMVMSL